MAAGGVYSADDIRSLKDAQMLEIGMDIGTRNRVANWRDRPMLQGGAQVRPMPEEL